VVIGSWISIGHRLIRLITWPVTGRIDHHWRANDAGGLVIGNSVRMANGAWVHAPHDRY
jgi:hypothetical protein